LIEMRSAHVARAAATFVSLDAVVSTVDTPATRARNARNQLRASVQLIFHLASFTPASGSR